MAIDTYRQSDNKKEEMGRIKMSGMGEFISKLHRQWRMIGLDQAITQSNIGAGIQGGIQQGIRN